HREDARRGRQDGRHAGDDRADVRRRAIGGAGGGGAEGKQTERQRRARRHRRRPHAPGGAEEKRQRSDSERTRKGKVEHDGKPERRHGCVGRGRGGAGGVKREKERAGGGGGAGGAGRQESTFPAFPAFPAMLSIRAHSASDTGITESREILTSAKVLKNG